VLAAHQFYVACWLTACGLPRMLSAGYPLVCLDTATPVDNQAGRDNAALTEPASSHGNSLHLAAHGPDVLAGGTGENAPAKRPTTCPGVLCRETGARCTLC
jgi:hypothetical protein